MSDKIMITCPTAAVPVWTGFKGPPGSNLTGLTRVEMRHCSVCGNAHTWRGEDAYWQDEDVRARSFWENFRGIRRRPRQG